jgi:hypothetical protein
MDYENPFSPSSGAGSAPELIPDGTLAWAIIKVTQRKNAKESGGEYYNIELTVHGGEYEGRKVFEMIPNFQDSRNSDKWRAMGVTSITRIMESAGFFKVGDPESYKAFAGKSFEMIANFLDGQRCAIKVKVEKNTDPAYADKNKVKEYLSPNPESRSQRDFERLVGGQGAVQQARSQAFSATSTPSTPGFQKPSFIKGPSSNNSPF